MTPEEIRQQALYELRQEDFRRAVDAYKKKLTATKWYHKIFPWKVIFIRRDV